MAANEPSLRALAVAALDADGRLLEAVKSKPDTLGGEWLAWYDDVLAPVRAPRERAVAAFIAHPEYPAAHRRCWGDEITTRTTARFAWIPPARLVANLIDPSGVHVPERAGS